MHQRPVDSTQEQRELRFLADLARWMQAGCFRLGRRLDGEYVYRDRIASGTLDAALWLLGVTDLSPVSHAPSPLPTGRVAADEREVARDVRAHFGRDDEEWLYLGGVLDLLDFALGEEAPFWWVPLPEKTRCGRVRRDIYGREVARPGPAS